MAQPLSGPKTVAVAVLRQGEEIVLVSQQGPKDPEPHWALPTGVVEPGELLLDALRREVREETGAELVDPGRLAWVTQTNLDDPDWGGVTTAIAFETWDWHGELVCADPDGLVLAAELVPLTRAIELLKPLPLPMAEPAVAFLEGTAGHGSYWAYSAGPGFANVTLVGHQLAPIIVPSEQ